MGTRNSDDKSSIVDQIQVLLDNFRQNKLDEHSVKAELISYGRLSGFKINRHRKQAWRLLIESPSNDDLSGTTNNFGSLSMIH
jgi:hypothetical protein